jgi:hypothetical protein
VRRFPPAKRFRKIAAGSAANSADISPQNDLWIPRDDTLVTNSGVVSRQRAAHSRFRENRVGDRRVSHRVAGFAVILGEADRLRNRVQAISAFFKPSGISRS